MPLKAPVVGEAVNVIAAGDVSAPVFVDTTGRRGRRIRLFLHMAGVAALTYAVQVMIAALLFTGPLELLSFPAPEQSASATTPAKKNTPAPGQPGSTGKRTTGGWSVRSSPAPGAASASARPSGSVTIAPPPPTTATPSAAPSTEPTASAAPTTTQQPQPSAPQSSAPGITVVVVVEPE